MRIYLDQIGCRLNYSEMETLAGDCGRLVIRPLVRRNKRKSIVFNTCAVTADAVRGSRKQVRHLHSVNPNARIAVTGCWRPAATAAIALPGVTLVADNGQKDLLHTLLEPWSAELDDPDDLARLQPDGNPFSSALLQGEDVGARSSRTRAFIKVQMAVTINVPSALSPLREVTAAVEH